MCKICDLADYLGLTPPESEQEVIEMAGLVLNLLQANNIKPVLIDNKSDKKVIH